MTDGAKRSVALVAPYAAWMALMVALPATAWAYAVRGAVTAALLIAFLPTNREPRTTSHEPRVKRKEKSNG